jgi:hypothetical protein
MRPAAQAPGLLGICRLIICAAGCRHQQALGREASGPSPETKCTAQSSPHPVSCNVRLSSPVTCASRSRRDCRAQKRLRWTCASRSRRDCRAQKRLRWSTNRRRFVRCISRDPSPVQYAKGGCYRGHFSCCGAFGSMSHYYWATSGFPPAAHVELAWFNLIPARASRATSIAAKKSICCSQIRR